MINALNILLTLLNIACLIALLIYAKKVNDKNFKVEILDTKIKAIQKRITKEQTELSDLKLRLEEQKTVLDQKWAQLQNDGKILEEQALQLEDERRLLKAEHDKVTSQKIEIEQEQMKIYRIVVNFKEKWEQERKEVLKERDRLKQEFQQIHEAKLHFESTESKIKVDSQKSEKEKNYLAAQFKDLESSKREFEKNQKKLLEQEQQIKDMTKKHIEEKMLLDREREKINHEKIKIEEQKAQLVGFRDKLEREKLKLKNEKNKLAKLKHNPGLSVNADLDLISAGLKDSRFYLEGNILRDETEGMGQLFGKELPRIIDRQSWKNIASIVIGEEGEGSGGLRWKFKPETSSPALDLNQLEQQGKIAIISKSNKSCFFIEFHDNHDDMVDCLDFRFAPGLSAIEVDASPCLPGINGHQPVKVKFLHEKSCTIRLAQEENKKISINSSNEITRATIPPDPAWDITQWQIEDRAGRKTKIKLVMNRIWWSMTDDSEQAQQVNAVDKIMEIPFNDLQKTSHQVLVIWLPKQHDFRQMSIGFDKLNRKTARVARTEEKLLLPLKEIIDNDVLQNLNLKRPISLWLDEETNAGIAVAAILPPWLSCKAKDCNFKSPEKDEMIIHIKDNHVHHFYHELNYEEIRLNYNLELPVQIYRCGYCNQYILAAKNLENPVNAIIDHIEKCPKAEKKDGAVQIKFKIVKESREVRKHVIKDLPQAWKCNWCDRCFEDQKEDEMISHLISAHEGELYS